MGWKNPFALSSFTVEVLDKNRACLNCRKTIRRGEQALVTRWSDGFGRKTSVLCDEECWRDYDDRYWQAKADENRFERMFERVYQRNYEGEEV